jgi:hypothetical protein
MALVCPELVKFVHRALRTRTILVRAIDNRVRTAPSRTPDAAARDTLLV